jgi:hypothetical protein
MYTSADRHAEWRCKLREMEHLQDGMGKGLDPFITETVAVLQLLGVHTRASCEGHLDHGVAAPWIDIQSPDPRLEELQEHYCELGAKLDELRDDAEAAEALYDSLHAISSEGDRIEAVEYQKLIPYLDEFYRDRCVYYEDRLIIDSRGRLISQGALLQPAEEMKTQALRLQAYQEQMRDFTEFLKQKFFS